MDVLSSLYNNRSTAQFHELQGSKQSAWTCPDHHDLLTIAHVVIMRVNIGIVLRHLVLIDTHGQINKDGSLARIDAALQHAHMGDALARQSFFTTDVVGNSLFRSCLLGENAELVFKNHFSICFMFCSRWHTRTSMPYFP